MPTILLVNFSMEIILPIFW